MIRMVRCVKRCDGCTCRRWRALYGVSMLNMDRIEELRAIMGADFEHLIAQALQDMQVPLAALERAASGETDPERLGFALHTLQGIASNIGCTDIAERCSRSRDALDADQFTAAMARSIIDAIAACQEKLDVSPTPQDN